MCIVEQSILTQWKTIHLFKILRTVQGKACKLCSIKTDQSDQQNWFNSLVFVSAFLILWNPLVFGCTPQGHALTFPRKILPACWWICLAIHSTFYQHCLSLAEVAMLHVSGKYLAFSYPGYCPLPVHIIPINNVRSSFGGLVNGYHRKARLKIQDSHSLPWTLRSLVYVLPKRALDTEIFKTSFFCAHFFTVPSFLLLAQTIAEGK